MPMFNTFTIPSSNDVGLEPQSATLLPTQYAVKTYIGMWGGSGVRVYNAGALKTAAKLYYATFNVSSGSVTFYLTTDGTAAGTPIFSNVDQASFGWSVNDATNQYQLGGYTLSGDKKSITLTVNKLGSVILGLIQVISAANGVACNLQVWGD